MLLTTVLSLELCEKRSSASASDYSDISLSKYVAWLLALAYNLVLCNTTHHSKISYTLGYATAAKANTQGSYSITISLLVVASVSGLGIRPRAVDRGPVGADGGVAEATRDSALVGGPIGGATEGQVFGQ